MADYFQVKIVRDLADYFKSRSFGIWQIISSQDRSEFGKTAGQSTI
ncbi:hypothetical protein GMA3_89 [Gordonia phage GMA3]|uniref:Uncharacterized protein n=1 Tax=Gordonia phage GMA3 TaxID=1647284 RepID=A0A0K0NKM9_9CAUD|nr:hypothetical protein AU105_gp089 [Gordonia phage GMA3]AKL88266.1 hypothetical protein GMA3_89 [Gordonia phage GMA3]